MNSGRSTAVASARADHHSKARAVNDVIHPGGDQDADDRDHEPVDRIGVQLRQRDRAGDGDAVLHGFDPGHGF